MRKEQGNCGEERKQPNILILMVDQLRFPVAYETEKLKEWQEKNLLTQQLLRKNGMEFMNHYGGSTACAPSRATLYTGQYPSLHGVTQTPGAAKGSFDPEIFWLDPNTVPTMGDYFRAAGYQTYWKGKWHVSDEDILIPGTHNALASYDETDGKPVKDLEEFYQKANRLEPFGFSDWIGPEPHGADPRNSGSSAAVGTSGRDEMYANDTVNLIMSLEKNENSTPWLIMCSFINPHDIALYGELTNRAPNYHFEADLSLPYIPQAPTAKESLSTKPQAQRSYRNTYPKALQPIIDNNFYRQVYYSLQKKADEEMLKVFQALKQSTFYENTIVLFTSDHGELLGAHGGLYQKWYTMYEEAIHIPLIIHSPKLFQSNECTNMLTSHVDVLPTLLGLAGIKADSVQEVLAKSHNEVHPFAGRNLTPLLKGNKNFMRADEPLYFMTDDDVTKGLNQTTITGQSYTSVIQPNHIEAVITTLRTGICNKKEIWKFARYFDNTQFSDDNDEEPVPDEYELYNLTRDPLEENNMAHPAFATAESARIQHILARTLEEQCNQKRRSPSSGDVPGMLSCD
ncbi:sulfatase-like hydrolase/transferase [bacterium LRH843]|nr:sulfatase-like hydrolase/transferase [bacterium LRH843]